MLKRWNRISCIALVLAAFSLMQVARAETAANAFVVVEAEGVRIGDGDVIHFANATSATPVRVTARTGWRVNGQKEISFVRAANESGSLHLVSVLGEDETHIPYEDCTFDYTVATNHVLAPQIMAAAPSVRQIALYALPETGADVSVSANVTLLQEGEHEIVTTWKPCPRCGATRNPLEERRRVSSSPSAYAWTATAGGVATNSSTWTGRLSKGLGQEVSFAVVGENGCSDCACRASTAVAVDVCALSIDRPDFIGLDRTDAGRANPTIYSAAVNLDPEPSATISYDWRDCGICSFTGRTDQARVRYFAPDPDRASASFLAEPLTVAVGVGDSVAANCTTNFTVVKVDVRVDGVEEVREESEGVCVKVLRAEDDIDGTCDVAFSCQPVVRSWTLNIEHEKGSEDDFLVAGGAASSEMLNEVRASRLSDLAATMGGKDSHGRAKMGIARIKHRLSGAEDLIRYTVFGISLYAVMKRAKVDADEARKTLGVGECVLLNASPADLFCSWESSLGSFSDGLVSNATAACYMQDREGTGYIKADFGDKGSDRIPVSVVAPSSVSLVEVLPESKEFGTAGVMASVRIDVLPLNVSFSRVQFKEISSEAESRHGYFGASCVFSTSELAHHPNSEWGRLEGNQVVDMIGVWPLPAPWQDGGFKWIIPARWRVVDLPDEHIFPWSDQSFWIDSEGTVGVAKFGVCVSRTTNDVSGVRRDAQGEGDE